MTGYEFYFCKDIRGTLYSILRFKYELHNTNNNLFTSLIGIFTRKVNIFRTKE